MMTEHEMFTMPAEELPKHSRVPFRIVPDVDTLYREMAEDIIEQIKRGNERGEPIKFIWPVGPIGQYPILVEAINRERISMKNVWIFMMDEYLDWQGRPIPEDHPLSFVGFMKRNFFELLDDDLKPPPEQIWFPHPFKVDEIDAKIEEIGGIDSCYGGVGIHGHIAFNESPVNRWYEVSAEEFKNSKTRVLQLAPETLVVNGIQAAGGNFEYIPPMAVTLGMKVILGARRIRLYLNRGLWQRTILRRALLMEPTVCYPVTFVQEHPDALITADLDTAQPPLGKLV
ncbi:MAG TPA: glucosamine-6-phosphate isomerase [Armatimonadetes bacterium]|nr:glucosamine-6-phosphate isomerase [Armatimonadota bacterium]